MRRVAHVKEEIAGHAAARAAAALARNANGLAVLHAYGDADFEVMRLGLACPRVGLLKRDGANRAVHDFVERDEKVAFDVVAARRAAGLRELIPVKTILTETKSSAAAAAEQLLEKVAEACATKMKLLGFRAVGAAPGSALPARRRLEAPAFLPARTVLIIFLALLRIAQDLISLIDLLELFLGGLFVLGHVGMGLAGHVLAGTFKRLL